MRLLGVLPSGSNPTVSETADCLIALNGLLEAFRLDKLLVYSVDDQSLAMVAGTSSYTIGSGGTLDTTRPVKLDNAYMRNGTTDYPVTILTSAQWDAIEDKTTTGSIVEYAYYDADYPLGTLKVWPVPTSTDSLYLSFWTPLTALTSADVSVSLPPAYERMLAFSLAIEIAPEFGTAASPDIIGIAKSTRAAIRVINMKPIIANVNFGGMFGGNSQNILTGQ